MNYDLVVAGAGEGGLTVMAKVAPHWPVATPPVVIALTAGDFAAQNVLQVIDSYAPIPFKYAVHGEALQPGQGYLCPPRKHIFIGKGKVIYLDDGNAFDTMRPSINRLFASAAAVFGQRVIGILANAQARDGAQGLRHIESAGGIRILQDVEDDMKPLTPWIEFRRDQASYCIPAAEIGPLVNKLLYATP